MKNLRTLSCLVFIFGISLAGCAPARGPIPHTDFSIGDEYVANEELVIMEYDYLQIPLVKPGIQLMDPKAMGENPPEEMKVKITGKVHKGDQLKISDVVEEGGWIPCKGDYYLQNVMVEIQTGESAGREVGISLISSYDRKRDESYKTGKVLYLKYEPKYIKKSEVTK